MPFTKNKMNPDKLPDIEECNLHAQLRIIKHDLEELNESIDEVLGNDCMISHATYVKLLEIHERLTIIKDSI